MNKIIKHYKHHQKAVLITVGALAAAGVLFYGVYYFLENQGLTPEAAKAKTEEFINKNLLSPGTTAVVEQITEENGLYKVSVKLSNGQQIDSYISKDGTKFFPQVMDVAEVEKQTVQSGNQERAAEATRNAEIPKTDKPKVELFVMSHCPYGIQIEKGIIPAIETLGNKIDFSLKFCDYAMHGEKELQEQLAQYCIQKNEPAKLLGYLKCFLKAGDSAGCLKTAGVNSAKLNSCVTDADKQHKVTEKFKDQASWGGKFPPFDIHKDDNKKYGVQGSPTLVINGVQSGSARDSSSLLKSICSGFSNTPAECQKSLSNASPSAGFGEGTAAAGSAAGCAE